MNKGPRLPTHGKRCQVNLYINPDILNKVEDLAGEEKRSMSGMFCKLVDEALKRRSGNDT